MYSSEEETYDASHPATVIKSASDYSSNEDNNNKREAVIVACATNTKERHVWDKVFYCKLCGNTIKDQLPRHLSRHHMDKI